MNIAIVGGGSTGLLLSAYLGKMGHAVTCYVRRSEQMERIQQHNGITLLPSKEKTVIEAKDVLDAGDHDIYIFCVKQPQLQEVVARIERKVRMDKPFLFLQNGMGHIRILSELNRPIYVGVLDHGAKRIDDYTVLHTGKGSIRIGSYDKKDTEMLHQLITVLHHDDFPVYYVEHWKDLLKEKLIVNAVINPLTALFQVKNGTLLENEYLNHLAKKLCEEACQVLNFPYQTTWEYVQQVALQTKENSSSMLQDILKKSQTEIDAISGYLVETSEGPIPNTVFVYEAIKAKEILSREE